VQVADFRYELPPELIAQTPAAERDRARLLVWRRSDGTLEHRRFGDISDFLRAGDVLVLNDTRVIPARLRGAKGGSPGRIEVMLAEENAANDWWVMLRPGKRVRPGTELVFSAIQRPEQVRAVVLEKGEEGLYRLRFAGPRDIRDLLGMLGEVPLPPYIARPAGADLAEDAVRYQTVYARVPGAVAAPTAGLHFTLPLLRRLERLGVELCPVTLEVGLGTFAPVKSGTVEGHRLHAERFELTAQAAAQLEAARATGRRIIAVGTTSVRVLEHVAAEHGGQLRATRGQTRLFVYPPHRFRVVDALITNFHLPESTLLMLVSAFADPGGVGGRESTLQVYAEAVRRGYRFYSYGDAMLIL
jgi:S-adenosylmethionine:tRNA ribosyltransferase-isomerase